MMVISIDSDSDMPTCLNTLAKQKKHAKRLVEATGAEVKKTKEPPIQGCFSRTIFVDLKNGEEKVVQFRPEPLDIAAFQVARGALGAYVPEVQLLDDGEMKSNSIWSYLMSRIPGNIWLDGARGKGSQGHIAMTKSLGKLLSKGFLSTSSDDAIEKTVRPHLERLALADADDILPYKEFVKESLKQLDSLKPLPLFVAHFDLNAMNILVDDYCHVTGLVDWELSRPLPFGMGFSRIHDLAGEFSEGEFHMPDEFCEAETDFWNALFQNLPSESRGFLSERLPLIQTAVRIGTLLHTFELEMEVVGEGHPVGLKALPKFLTYRLPMLRGSDPPYSV